MDLNNEAAGNDDSDAFDAEWYVNRYPDVKLLNMDPWDHFRWIGRKLGRIGSKAGNPVVSGSMPRQRQDLAQSRGPWNYFMEPSPDLPEEKGGTITRLMKYVWDSRPDLQQVFDLTVHEGRNGLRHWFNNSFKSEYGLDVNSPQPGALHNRDAHGANLIGYAKGELGMGEHVRMVAKSLDATGFPFDIVNVTADGHGDADNSADRWITQSQRFATNIFHINADMFPIQCLRYGQGFYNIGFWAWELSESPPEFDTAMNIADEVWGCSEFTANAFKGRASVPVFNMPLAVEVPDLSPRKYNKARYGLASDKFTFLFTFDAASYLDRKNPIDIVRAFNIAFPKDDEPVHLVFKVQNTRHIVGSGLPQILWQSLIKEIGESRRITIIDRRFERDEVFGLSLACDAFVSLHRSEGFGRNLTEAMSYGKPVISTDYSGSREFINNDTACPIDFKLIPVPNGAYPFSEGQVWAQPDVEQAAFVMKKLFEDEAFRSEKGAAGRKFVKENFSESVVGARYKQRLEEIEGRTAISLSPRSIRSSSSIKRTDLKRYIGEKKTALFTITSSNYVSYARTVLGSVAAQHPEYALFLCLADEPEQGFDISGEEFMVLPSRDIGIPSFKDMTLRYDIMEFNTAVKPFVFKYLFQNTGLDNVIYFDPDLFLYQRLDAITDAFGEGASAVLTPHVSSPLPDDDKSPDDYAFLQSGVFNLGFIALRRCQEARDFADWWAKRLQVDAIAAFEKNLFTDQRWCDLAPCFLPNLRIFHDPGYNVAYWNLANRRVEQDNSAIVRVNGVPLVFFHFSGINPRKLKQVSKHQTRFSWDDLSTACQRLFEDYATQLLGNGWEEALNYPYAYEKIDGWVIPPVVREIYRTLNPRPRQFADDRAAKEYLLEICNRPARHHPEAELLVPEVMLHIYKSRPDLQQAFDISDHGGHLKFHEWFATSGLREYDIPKTLLKEAAFIYR